MQKVFLLLCLLWAPSVLAAAVSSPDGRIEVEVSASQGAASYQVRFNGTTVIAPSRLGLTFAELATLGDGVKLGEVTVQNRHEPWEQPWGEQRFIENRFQQLSAAFLNEVGREVFTLEVRVFNDGLGFRYHVPKLIEAPVSLIDELTQFVLPDAQHADAWWIPAREWNRYEYLYEQTKADAVRLVHTPVTFRKANGVHVSIHEAALVDYAAMSLKQERTGVLKADLAPWSDGVLVKTSLPLSTPWRTLQIADSAAGLLNSALSLNLNEPNKLGDVSWVEPGKYIGIWWGMHINKNTWGSGPAHGATTSEAKRYIDFAAAHGFDGVLIEGWNIGWDGDWFFNGEVFSFTEAYPDFDIQAVTDYARERGVRLIGHHETSGNVTNYEAQMEDAFALYESVGVTQVKTGYVADGGDIVRHTTEGFQRHEWHDGQYMVNHYLRNVRLAAEHKISINTHEPVKDTGLRRTYPNWISREGARGQEFNAWGSPPNPPAHIPTLAFTRLLAGPMDFTPGIVDMTFNGLDGWNRPQTTVAKQLASYVVIYSPIQMAADLPENYQQHPVALEFIESVVTDWEQSVALAGEVGEFVVQARQERDGQRWFVGGMTNENSRSLALPLSFLLDDQKYTLTLYRDAPATDWRTNPAELVKESFTVTRGSSLNIKMVASGGFAAILTPQ